jgi:hypothetical protein
VKVVTRLEGLLSKLVDRWWYRWHPTVALRYLPVVEEINKFKYKYKFKFKFHTSPPTSLKLRRTRGLRGAGKSKDLVVVEVGSGGLGLAPYLKSKVIGVDRDFGEVTVPWLVKVEGVGGELPFRSRCADWVILTDVLEHVVRKDRSKVVSEAVRICRKWIVVGQPCGVLSEKQDQELDKLYRERFGKEHPFLGEHVKNKLPSKKEMEEMIRNAVHEQGREISEACPCRIRRIRVVGNMNLKVRRWLMRGWMTRNPLVDLFFRKVLLLAIPVLRRCNWEPVYRWIWVVEMGD